MGTIEVGRGNNGHDGTEGAVYKNAIGCYLHGALLPKNPKLTDWLIEGGLHRRYGKLDLPVLNDELEDQAHVTAVARARVTR
jgi:CobQ-like glutamine amidotransferase family enzyme